MGCNPRSVPGRLLRDPPHTPKATGSTKAAMARIVAMPGVRSSTQRPNLPAVKPAPSSANRVLDATALLMVLGGISLFAFARNALTGIGTGTRAMPEGISAVTVTDFHVAQSTMGLWTIGLGVMVGIVAAVRHRLGKAV